MGSVNRMPYKTYTHGNSLFSKPDEKAICTWHSSDLVEIS